MANTNPENKVDDSPPPVDWVVVAPNAYSGGNEIYQAHPGKTGHTQSRDETPPPPSRSFSFDDITYFLRDPAETPIVENEGGLLPWSGVDLLKNGRSFCIGSGGGTHVLVGVFLRLF